MISVSDEQFQELVTAAMTTLPEEHVRHLRNVAILYEAEPSFEQRKKLQLRKDQTLFGLYEGVPLSERQGLVRILPDKITLFTKPLLSSVNSLPGLKEQIRHTLWHEIAHYYGLNHAQIDDLDHIRFDQ